MSEFELPEGWVECRLGDYLYVKNGYAFKSNLYIKEPLGSVPVIRIGDLDGRYVTLDSAVYVKENETFSAFEIHSGDLLIAMSGATTGKAAVFKQYGRAYQNQRVGNIKLYNQNLGCELFRNYLLSSLSSHILKIAYGGAQPNISGISIENIVIQIPPLAEQREIAARLDGLLAQVDSIKGRLDGVPALLKRFRQAVLAAAVSGGLTEEWRGKKSIIELGWKSIQVKDLVSKIEAGKNLKCVERPPFKNEFGIIKISAVTWGVYNEEESKTLPDSNLFLESRRIREGDFLISRANTLELLGNPVIVHKVTKNLMLSDKVLRLVAKDLDKKWLRIFLLSFNGRREIESRSTGNQLSMRNIGQQALLDIPLPLPPLEEQTEIVRRVETLFAFADQLEARVKAAQAQVNQLTQAILAKAFRGELTAEWRAQHPELISGENSAAALLQRIQAERAQSSTAGKGAKGRGKKTATNTQVDEASHSSASSGHSQQATLFEMAQ